MTRRERPLIGALPNASPCVAAGPACGDASVFPNRTCVGCFYAEGGGNNIAFSFSVSLSALLLFTKEEKWENEGIKCTPKEWMLPSLVYTQFPCQIPNPKSRIPNPESQIPNRTPRTPFRPSALPRPPGPTGRSTDGPTDPTPPSISSSNLQLECAAWSRQLPVLRLVRGRPLRGHGVSQEGTAPVHLLLRPGMLLTHKSDGSSRCRAVLPQISRGRIGNGARRAERPRRRGLNRVRRSLVVGRCRRRSFSRPESGGEHRSHA